MSLGETRKLLQQSRKIVDEAADSTNISVLLNTILKLVSSIDVRLQGVEKSVGKFDEIETIITSLSSRNTISTLIVTSSTDLGPRMGLPDQILKGDHQRIILAKLESMIGPVV
jgi:hypothetical protein